MVGIMISRRKKFMYVDTIDRNNHLSFILPTFYYIIIVEFSPLKVIYNEYLSLLWS